MLGDFIQSHSFKYHPNARDSQMYIICSHSILNSRFHYPTTYQLPSVGCVIHTSNLTCPKPSSSSSLLSSKLTCTDLLLLDSLLSQSMAVPHPSSHWGHNPESSLTLLFLSHLTFNLSMNQVHSVFKIHPESITFSAFSQLSPSSKPFLPDCWAVFPWSLSSGYYPWQPKCSC